MEEKQRKSLPIILGINLSIIILATLSNIQSKQGLFTSGLIALCLVGFNFIAGILSMAGKLEDIGGAFLLVSGLCLLISGGLCTYSGLKVI